MHSVYYVARLKCFTCILTHLIPQIRYYFYLYFIDNETENREVELQVQDHTASEW